MTAFTLEKWRERNDWDKYTAAVALNVDLFTYGKLERGELPVTDEIIQRCKNAGLIHAIQKAVKPHLEGFGSGAQWAAHRAKKADCNIAVRFEENWKLFSCLDLLLDSKLNR